jgi:HTH-type transcriptional regulator / antitoxin HigA
MKAAKLEFSDMPRDYDGLVAMHPPRPLHDEVDEQNVEEIVAAMAGHELSPEQEDYLDVMSDLLLKYHAQKQAPRRRRRPVHERLKYVMSESGTTPTQLARILRCSQPLVSLILSGKRELSKENIKKLADYYRLEGGYFL